MHGKKWTVGNWGALHVVVIHVYWFRKAFDVAEKQFDHSVQVVPMKVADSVFSRAEVKKLSSSFFFVAIGSQLNNETLDTLLKVEFLKRSLSPDYELGIYNAGEDTLVYGQYGSPIENSGKDPGRAPP